MEYDCYYNDIDNSDEINNSILIQEYDTIKKTFQKAVLFKNDHAKRHLIEGCARRQTMMQTSRVKIFTRTKNKSPLSIFEVDIYTIFLDAYYFNLRGALDNIAWALTYEFDLETITDEEKVIRKIDLFKCTCNKIEMKNKNIYKIIKKYTLWNNEVKKIRDPIAHRIPVCFYGNVLTEDELLLQNSIYDDINCIFCIDWKNNYNYYIEKIGDLQSEAQSIGNFLPFIDLSSDDGHKTCNAVDQMNIDQTIFLNLINGILDNVYTS